MPDTFFPPKPDIEPKIYAYRDKNPSYDGFLKVGFTARDVEGRVAQQYPTKRPGELPYEILLEESAVWSDGGSFTDHDIHRYLRKRGFRNPAGEWFECEVDDVLAAILAVREGIDNDDNRTQDFKMRPEQAAAVEKTARYFSSFKDEGTNETPHFLWNAKMRFGKTFASYQLAKRMGWKRVLVLTFKPAVQNVWEDDLKSHIDFKGWQFVSRGGLSEDDVDMSRPIVCFGSFQDFLGKNSAGGIKAKNEWVKKPEAEKAKSKRMVIPDGTIQSACGQACPTGGLAFGDLLDPESRVSKLHADPRAYELLGELNIKTRNRYLARLTNPIEGERFPEDHGGHGGHGGHGDSHDAHAEDGAH